MTYKTEKDRKYWVDRYNSSLPQVEWEDSDGEKYSIAKKDGIYDSAYMNFVHSDDLWRSYANWPIFKKLNKFVKKIQKENEPVLTEHSKERKKRMERQRETRSWKKFCDQQEQKIKLDPEYWKAKFGDCGEIGNQIIEHYKNKRREKARLAEEARLAVEVVYCGNRLGRDSTPYTKMGYCGNPSY